MKKIFLFIAIASVAVSCSSDSSSGSSKLASAVSYNDGTSTTIYSFTYDGSKRLTGVTKLGTTNNTYTLTYGSSNRIASIVKSGDTTGLTSFVYDSNGRLTSFSQDGGTPTAITYSGGTYTVGSISYSLNSRSDIATVLSSDLFTFNYDTGKKGVFNNVKGNTQILGLYMENAFLFMGSKKPLTSISAATPANNYVMTNTYDEDGYITATSATLGGTANYSATVSYSE